MEKEYVFINGLSRKKSEYANASSPFSEEPLTVLSSEIDVDNASSASVAELKLPVRLAHNTHESINTLKKNGTFTPLEQVLSRYEIPLGMIPKLMSLAARQLDFIFDDSGSMNSETDVDLNDAVEPLKSDIKRRLGRDFNMGEKMTRWQEAENRFHIMLEILACLPIPHIQLRFLNDKNVLVLDRQNRTLEQFKSYAHALVRDHFHKNGPRNRTPVYAKLNHGFKQPGTWSHYLFNDGEPDEGGAAIAFLIKNRSNPEKHALTLVSCTNQDGATDWMKDVDGDAVCVAELDDLNDEKREVKSKQGLAMPYTQGLWIVCQLVASINPDDLDALDENLPFTKFVLDELLGYKLNPYEYQHYFKNNRNAALYVNEYVRFLTHEGLARDFISIAEQERRERSAGYNEGARPAAFGLTDLTTQLEPHTRKAMQALLLLDDVLPTNGATVGSVASNSNSMFSHRPAAPVAGDSQAQCCVIS